MSAATPASPGGIGGAAAMDAELTASGKDPNNVIVLRNVCKTYLLGIEGVPALRGITLTIRRGEFVVILGKSGSGKTSLLNVLGTIDKPTRGDLFLGGVRVDAKTPDSTLADIRLRRLAFIFQTFNLLPQLSVLENVELPMVLAGWGTRASRRRRALKLLSRVGLSERVGHTPNMCRCVIRKCTAALSPLARQVLSSALHHPVPPRAFICLPSGMQRRRAATVHHCSCTCKPSGRNHW